MSIQTNLKSIPGERFWLIPCYAKVLFHIT